MKEVTVAVGKFKDSCLRLMEEVHRHRTTLVVTKRGRPLVRILPIEDERASEDLVGLVVHEAPDIFSTGEKWDAES